MATKATKATEETNEVIIDKTLLTAKDVMAMLQIGRAKLTQLMKTGEIKGVKLGRDWRFSREQIEAFVKEKFQG